MYKNFTICFVIFNSNTEFFLLCRWIRRLSKLINDWRERGHDFFTDHNPIERVNYDYYGMSNRDKVI